MLVAGEEKKSQSNGAKMPVYLYKGNRRVIFVLREQILST
jgi:hypothetical protein